MPAIYPVDNYWQLKVGKDLVKIDGLENSATKFSNDRWYNIRIEYTYSDTEKLNNGVATLRIYINDVLGYENTAFSSYTGDNSSGSQNDSTLSKILFNIRKGTTTSGFNYDTTFYLDNVYVGTQIADNLGNGAHADDELTNKYGEGDLAVTEKAEASANRTSADIYTYETDFIWNGEDGSFVLNLLASQTEGTASIASVYATAANGVITIASSEGGKTLATLLAGKWANIRVEYTPASKTVAGATDGETVTEYSGKYVIYVNGAAVGTVTSAAEKTVSNVAYAGAEIVVSGEGLTIDNTFCNAEYVDEIGTGKNYKDSDKYGEGDLAITDTKTFNTNAYYGDTFTFETDFKWVAENGSIVIVDKDGEALVTIDVTVSGEFAELYIGETKLASVAVGYWRNISVAYNAGVFTITAAGNSVTVEKVAGSFGGVTVNGQAVVDNTFIKVEYTDYQGKGANASAAIKYNKTDAYTTDNAAAVGADKTNDDVLAWIAAAQKAFGFGKKFGSLAVDFGNSKTGNSYIFETDLSFVASGVGAADDAVYFTIAMESNAGDIFTIYALGVYEIDELTGAKYVALSTSESIDDAFAYVREDLWYNIQIVYNVTEAETAGKFAGEWTVVLNGAVVANGTVESDVDNTTFKSAEMELSADVYDIEIDLQKTYVGATTIATEE